MNTRVKDYHHIIDTWLQTLEPYDIARLLAQPAPGAWSLGQVYMHMLDESEFYFNQIKICLASNDYAMEEATSEAKAMLRNNAFPDEVIEGPATNAFVRQPDCKQLLTERLLALKKLVRETDRLIATSLFRGKAWHPGLHYLGAEEWFQFSEMHFRHHLRQKARIEAFLERTFGPLLTDRL
ncbi:DinB family protein [Dyadobacter sp. CY261]|uniref:DinB family protein n=1 Tax=Dyadobacter sp. CY261 TaxID=2907203 RepID=UPI001F3CE2E8|nr:DinB family protein [Dyadobacter sp. CY261]MCF0074718.1 DinB family protein [Dyadobacter sp. CY261]